jgi:hypothetical protein
MTVNCLPLAYKRRRRSSGRRGRHIATHSHFPPSSTILALILNKPSGTWRLLLLSRFACSSPLRAPRCHAIQRHECTPTGRMAHGRNQDKPRVIVLLAPTIERPISALLLVSVKTTFRTDNSHHRGGELVDHSVAPYLARQLSVSGLAPAPTSD